MTESTQDQFGQAARSDWVRTQTLVALRWLAIFGQAAAVFVASAAFDIELRLDLCAVVIGALILFNAAAIFANPPSHRLSESGVMLTLLFDLSQLVVLLGLTGGLANPFSLLVLAPVTISATALTLQATVFVSGAAIIMITAVGLFSLPLMAQDGAIIAPPALLLAGTWASLVVGIVFVAAYARRVTVESYSMSEALAATQLALAREQRLTALGGVVAAAAHELGTPLATIKLVAAELAEELQERPDLLDDVALIRSQTERCRTILRDMGRAGRDDALMQFLAFEAMIVEAAEPHMERGSEVTIRIGGEAAEDVSELGPLVIRKPEILHGVRNLVQNAVDFSDENIWIDIDWDDATLRLTIGDDGPGFSDELRERIGDPFLRRRGATQSGEVTRPGYEGMGLGLFIAKTLLERSGAVLDFDNGGGRRRARASETDPIKLSPPGAIVRVNWPRSALEAPIDQVRGPLGRNQLNHP